MRNGDKILSKNLKDRDNLEVLDTQKRNTEPGLKEIGYEDANCVISFLKRNPFRGIGHSNTSVMSQD